MYIKSALIYCQLCLLLISCSTLGPKDNETMLIGRLIVTEMPPQVSLHHLEFSGVISGSSVEGKSQRFYGVWFDKNSNAFSIPVPWHETTKAVTLKQMSVFLSTPLGEQKMIIDVNLELMGEERKCLDLGDWTIDISNAQLNNINRINSSQELSRIELFKHCPQP